MRRRAIGGEEVGASWFPPPLRFSGGPPLVRLELALDRFKELITKRDQR